MRHAGKKGLWVQNCRYLPYRCVGDVYTAQAGSTMLIYRMTSWVIVSKFWIMILISHGFNIDH